MIVETTRTLGYFIELPDIIIPKGLWEQYPTELNHAVCVTSLLGGVGTIKLAAL